MKKYFYIGLLQCIMLSALYAASTISYQDSASNQENSNEAFSFSNFAGGQSSSAQQSSSGASSTPIVVPASTAPSSSDAGQTSDLGFSLSNLSGPGQSAAPKTSLPPSNSIATTLQQTNKDQTLLQEKSAAADQEQQQKELALELDPSYSAGIARLYQQGLSIQYGQLMQKIRSKNYTLVDVQSVADGYTSVVKDFVQGYTNAGMPITVSSSCYAFTCMQILMNLYASIINYYIQQSMQAANGTALLATFVDQVLQTQQQCDATVKTLAASFPDTVAQKILASWYTKGATALLPASYTVMQKIGSSDRAIDMSMLQNLVDFILQAKQFQLDVAGYKNYADYITGFVDLAEQVYLSNNKRISNDISLLTTSLHAHIADYHAIARWYKGLLAMYTAVQKNTQSLLTKDQQTHIAQKIALYSAKLTEQRHFVEHIAEDKALMQSMALSIARMQKVVTNPQAVLSDVENLFFDIAQNLDSCQQSLAWYKTVQALDDQNSVELVIARLQYLHNQTAIKYFWLLFLSDTTKGAAALQTIAPFMQQAKDANYVQHSTTIVACCAYLNQIMIKNITTQMNPVPTYAKYITQSLPQYASTLMPLLSSLHMKYATPTATGLAQYTQNMQVDQALVSVISWYEQLIVALYYFVEYASKQSIQDVHIVQAYAYQIVQIAEHIDACYARNSDVAWYMPALTFGMQTSGKSMSLVMYMGSLLAYVLRNNAQVALDEQAAVAYGQLALFFKGYMTSDVVQVVEQMVQHQATSADFLATISSMQQGVGGKKNWVSSDVGTTNAAWHNILLLYQIAYMLAGSDASQIVLVQKAYEKSLQNYISTYQKIVTQERQHDDDLLFIYYQLYQLYTVMHDDTASSMLVWLQNYVSNAKKTGLFDQLSQAVTQYTTATQDADFQLYAQKIATQVQRINRVCQKQAWYEQSCGAMYGQATVYPRFMQQEKNDATGGLISTTYTVMWQAQGGQSTVVVVPNLSVQMVAQLQKGAQQNVADALASESKADFVTAAQHYTTAYGMYQAALAQPIQDTALQQQLQQDFSVTKTRLIAATNAALVTQQDTVSVAQVPNVALTYLMNAFSIVVPETVVSGVPVSCLQAVGKQNVAVTSSMLADVHNMYKLALVNAYLTAHGYTFAQCFSDTNLTAQTGVTPDITNMATQAQTWGNVLLEQQKNITYTLSIAADSQITITAHALQIPALHPWYSNAPYANMYFAAAQALYKPGTTAIGGGAATFAPGNDPVAAAIMQQYMNNCLLATAYTHAQQAQKDSAALQTQIAAAQKAKQEITLAQYMPLYTTIKNKYQTAFAALTDSSSGALAVYTKQGLSAQATQVQTYVLQLYQSYISLVNSLLIGDPTASAYTTLLYDLNISYTAQKKIDPTTTAAMNSAIAALFTKAGDACMNYMSGQLSAELTKAAPLATYEYAQAIPNYIAACEQYTKMNDAANMALAEKAKYRAYAYAIGQNLAEYMFVRANGVAYENAITGVTQAISFTQLLSDYAQFENQQGLDSTAMDPNELQSYSTVKKLILDALSMISVVTSAKTGTAKNATSAGDATAAVNLYLTKTLGLTLIGDAGSQTPNLKDEATITAIVTHALDGVKAFDGDHAKTVQWLNYVMQAADQIYFYDFLGATPESSAQDIATDYTLLSQALQAEGSSMQNPSSVYVG